MLRAVLVSLLLTGCVGSDPLDAGTPTCEESGVLFSETAAEVARSYGECSVAADCALVAVSVSCEDGAHYETCPLVVTASRAEDFRRQAEEEAGAHCLSGCISTPTCVEPTVVCVNNACGLE